MADTQLTFAILEARRALDKANQALAHLKLHEEQRGDDVASDVERLNEVVLSLTILESNLYDRAQQRSYRRSYPLEA